MGPKKDWKRLLCAVWLLLMMIIPCACSVQGSVVSETVQWNTIKQTGQMPLAYAKGFSVEYYEGGYARIMMERGENYLLVPQNQEIPDGLDSETVIIKQPLHNIYVAATSAMDLFRATGGLDCVAFSSLQAKDWYIDAVREQMEAGKMVYAGKYRAPDYELLVENGCTLAIESTMIYHEPAVKEQLEALGIPVLVEYSSYEAHPLGRMEWIKLYGLLTDTLQQAEAYFATQTEKLQQTSGGQMEDKTVAFFYVTANGAVNIRRTGDYVTEMIGLAGGSYVPATATEGDSALSTMNMQMEAFYQEARDADVLIYNSTIDNVLTSLDELYEKSGLFADFKAVQEGNVWCTGKNMFQESTATGDMIWEIYQILNGKPRDGELQYFHKLQ